MCLVTSGAGTVAAAISTSSSEREGFAALLSAMESGAQGLKNFSVTEEEQPTFGDWPPWLNDEDEDEDTHPESFRNQSDPRKNKRLSVRERRRQESEMLSRMKRDFRSNAKFLKGCIDVELGTNFLAENCDDGEDSDYDDEQYFRKYRHMWSLESTESDDSEFFVKKNLGSKGNISYSNISRLRQRVEDSILEKMKQPEETWYDLGHPSSWNLTFKRRHCSPDSTDSSVARNRFPKLPPECFPEYWHGKQANINGSTLGLTNGSIIKRCKPTANVSAKTTILVEQIRLPGLYKRVGSQEALSQHKMIRNSESRRIESGKLTPFEKLVVRTKNFEERKSKGFYCKVCKVALTRMEDFEEHNRGKLHRSRTTPYCLLCDMFFTSTRQLDEHKQGAKHRSAEIISAASARTHRRGNFGRGWAIQGRSRAPRGFSRGGRAISRRGKTGSGI